MKKIPVCPIIGYCLKKPSLLLILFHAVFPWLYSGCILLLFFNYMPLLISLISAEFCVPCRKRKVPF